MKRVALALIGLAGCSRFEGEAGGGGGIDVPPGIEVDEPPPVREARRDGGPPVASALCVPLTALPSPCDAVGQWRLTHGQPDSPCPFGASRHDIRLYETAGALCLDPVDDFQRLEPGNQGTCSMVLSGQKVIGAASVPYTETWTSWLTFSEGRGSGETQVAVSG